MRSWKSLSAVFFLVPFLVTMDRATAAVYCEPQPANLFIEVTPGGSSGGGTQCPAFPGAYCQNPPGVNMISGPNREVVLDLSAFTYTVRYRFPLTLVGNSQNTNTDFTAQLFWFNQSSPPAGDCLPGFNGCNPTTACGYLGAKLLFDSGDTYIQASGLTCANIPTNLGQYSFSVYRCHSPFFSCQRSENSTSADFGPDALRAALNCPTPPTNGCPDDSGGQMCCLGAGSGTSPGGGGGGTSGGGPGLGARQDPALPRRRRGQWLDSPATPPGTRASDVTGPTTSSSASCRTRTTGTSGCSPATPPSANGARPRRARATIRPSSRATRSARSRERPPAGSSAGSTAPCRPSTRPAAGSRPRTATAI